MRTLYKNLENQKFNHLMVIKKDMSNKECIRRNKWICKCICGEIISVRAEQLFNKQKSCGCKTAIDLNGKKFGKLTIIKRIPYQIKTYRDALWLCKCECGNEKILSSGHLRNHNVQSCGCLKWKGYKEIGGTFFNRMKHSAKIRKLKFTITIKEIWDLFLKQNRTCALSGLLLSFESKCEARNGTASLDRIDSKKDYTLDNVQWVHKDINYMKQDNTDAEFINYCKLVANYNK